MRRPLCVLCVSAIATQIIAAFVPQASFGILAAFCVAVLIAAFVVTRHGYCVCILIGVLFGVGNFMYTTANTFGEAQAYFGQTVSLVARVDSCDTSYIDDMYYATLKISSIDGESVDFSCYVPLMPSVEVGDVIEGTFTLDALEESTYLYSNYASGCFASGTYVDDFAYIGQVDGVYGFCFRLQQALSENIRDYLRGDEGAVLVAMTVGNDAYITTALTEAYRAAGISHVLVISGLHLAMFCGLNPISRRTWRLRMVHGAANIAIAAAVVLITGLSASILRAAFMVLLCNIGVFLHQRTDGITSLSLAGALLLTGNSYVACGLSFQLSFSATCGVFAGSAFATGAYLAFEKTKFAQRFLFYTPKKLPTLAEIDIEEPIDVREPSRLYFMLRTVFELLCVSLGAISFTFPVLVLWGMNVSAVALLTNLLSAALVLPILFFGLLCAVSASIPFVSLVSPLFAFCGGVFVKLLNALAFTMAALPFAELHFETKYVVCIFCVVGLFCFCAVQCRFKRRYTVLASVGIILFAMFMNDMQQKEVVQVSLIGTTSNPAVVIVKEQRAVVLLRGGQTNADTVSAYLQEQSVTEIVLLVELAASEGDGSDLVATQTVFIDEMDDFEQMNIDFDEIEFILYNTSDGGIVLFECGGAVLATTTGTPTLGDELEVDILLAYSTSPGSVSGEKIISLSSEYDWFALELVDGEQLYYGESVSLWARYGYAYEILNASNDAVIRYTKNR